MPHLLNKGMKQKMQYASRLGIPYVIIIGEDEENTETVSIKLMDSIEILHCIMKANTKCPICMVLQMDK